MKLSLDEKRIYYFLGIAAVVIGVLMCVHLAAAQTKYASPDLSEYYTSLMQPDNPKSSCCGDGDRYFADKTEACTAEDLAIVPSCAIVAIITDDGPNVFDVPDGQGGTRTIKRPPIPVGTRIPVPASKVRKNPIPNPTDRNIVFTGTSLYPYCWEPAALI
jgi:hypothetical protein